MDDVDMANDRAQIELDARIAATRNHAPHQDGPEHCECCDETIPLVRRRLGYSLCLPCAADKERERQVFAGAGR